MSGAGFQFETPVRTVADALAPVRVVGGAKLVCETNGGGEPTRISDLAEHGGYRLKFPATHARHLEAVQINTGGGVVGGDKVSFAVTCGRGSDAVYTTQAAERIYRSAGDTAEIDVALDIREGARLDWLPQETLIYSGARLRRRFQIDTAASGRLLIVECITFGRTASGEVLGEGLLRDTWRVRRDGKLIYADELKLAGNLTDVLGRSASAAGGRAVGFLLYVGDDASDRLDGVRTALGTAKTDWGASAWNGMLVARFLAPDPAEVRCAVTQMTETLARRSMPRLWMS